MRRRAWLAVAAAALVAAACTKIPVQLPSPQSAEPVPRDTGGLRAGFAAADITVPPGPGMAGYGPEGKRAKGYRGRLYARAMVLEDAAGQRIAIVQLDLDFATTLLHRRVAAVTFDSAGIGADRLLLTATHTHSAPGHFAGVMALDAFAASISGYDPELTAFLTRRVAEAVTQAARTLRPARAAWSIAPVWGFTKIRSFAAFQADTDPWSSPFPRPAGLRPDEAGVDPAWRMLRVDAWDAAAGAWRPRGAFSVFAIHGTGIPNGNDLFDPDIPGIVSREMEMRIDALGGRRPERESLRRRAVHVFANGAEGDVSPDWTAGTRCALPRMARARRYTGPRTPPQPDRWSPPPRDSVEACMRAAKSFTDSVGRALADAAFAQYQGLGRWMDEHPGEAARGMRIARAFVTLPRQHRGEHQDVCPELRVGTASMAGGEDGFSRLRGWKLLDADGPGFGIPEDTVSRSGPYCHDPKRVALGPLQGVVVGRHGFPDVMQLSAVRIGPLLLGTLPAEPTTQVGARIRAAMARHAGVAADSVALLSLTNGYVQYVATPEEYGFQLYEGASTQAGPRAALYLEDALARLAATLRPGAGVRPARVVPLLTWPGEQKRMYATRAAGPDASRVRRAFLASTWNARARMLEVRWRDLHPGRLFPADAPVLAIERRRADGEWEIETWDDDNRLEVRGVKRLRDGYEWQARWTPRADVAGEFRVVLLARQGLPPLAGDAFRIP